MISQRLSRVGLPLIAFVAAFVATAGLTVWAAESKAPASRSAKPGKGGKTADAKPAEGAGGTLRLQVDERPINRDGSDRISYAPVVKRTSASVVYVYSSKTVRGQDMSRYLNDPLLRRFFNLPDQPDAEEDEAPRGRNRGKNAPRTTPRNRTPDQTQQGLGSGVVISADGYIITNNHVVDDADDVRVSIGDSNKRYEAKVVGRDPGSDLAVLKIDATGLSPATFGDSDQLQVGDVVLAIGNPFGVGQSVSRGIVSALGRGMGMGVFEDFIQTDAAINPGNSGGALLDTDGRVVGINSAIVSRSGAFAGVGLAIPANLARSIAEQLANTGKVERGFLGVRPQELTEDLTAQFGTEKGALIAEVTEDSPADKAGIKSGDIVTRINTTEIRDARHLLLTISKIAPGTEVSVELQREGKARSFKVKLARRDEDALARGENGAAPDKDEGVLNGVGVGDITPEVRSQLQVPARIKGALITSVEADSPAAKQGLREGDIILELDRKPVANADQAVKLSEQIKGPKVLVLIWRAGRIRYLAIDESK